MLQAVRELTGFGLREAKNLVESTPQPILRYVSLEDAEKAVQKIANAGGKAQIHY
ncbi:MAG: ribosomal protein L7/L12 [Desertifilum sp.]|nr:ribosomal protein L7/L12 [Desertifilum sp.]